MSAGLGRPALLGSSSASSPPTSLSQGSALNRYILFTFLLGTSLSLATTPGCTTGGEPEDSGTINPVADGSFTCIDLDSVACLDNTHFSCRLADDGEFLTTNVDNCNLREDGRNLCVVELGCAVCRPDEVFCRNGDVQMCNSTGDGFTLVEDCDVENGFVCELGTCRNLCELATENQSYVGCEFYAVDLDNAALGAGLNASGQQYSVVVSNPGSVPTEVLVQRNVAPFGDEPIVEEVERVMLLPGDLEVLDLPRREVDGSSSFAPCAATAECPSAESCWCAGGVLVEDPPPVGDHSDCRCRNAPETLGQNDGTHSALSSQAYRVTSVLPIIAYQFNPLDNVGVFSNDASLLLPTSAVGLQYTVVGWPQTIAHSERPTEDFDSRRDDEDLRVFMAITGTEIATHVTVEFGSRVRRVVGVDGRPDALYDEAMGVVVPASWEFDIGPYDVINLETQGFNADFSGTRVTADKPVGIFIGSEASDVPHFNTLANRHCCADHLEEQLFPDNTLGRRFFIGRMPPRSVALNAAFLDPEDSVGEFNEPEYVRIVATSEGPTIIDTSLPPPFTTFTLERGQATTLTADQDIEINADRPIAVLQALPSQQRVGIPTLLPGGDPAIVAVPPVEQYRRQYVFLTPGLYAFDFVTIVAPRLAPVLLDERPISEWGCDVGAADGIVRRDDDPPPEWVVYRCQFSFPDVIGPPVVQVEDGVQNDGYHTLRSTEVIGLVVYGFDEFVSYAYAGGLDLDPLN